MIYRFVRQLALVLCVNHPGLCIKLANTMETMRHLWLKALKISHYKAYMLIGLLILAATPVFANYGGLSLEQILFFVTLPLTLGNNRARRYTEFTFVASALFLGLFYLTHVYSIFYMGFTLSILLALMLTPKQPGLLSYVLAGISTPAFQYLFQVFSFSIRLFLTRLAGKVLALIFPAIELAGNSLVMDGVSFTVAPECMGLNMLSAALIVAISSLAYMARRFNKRIGIFLCILFLLATLLLVIGGNISRIILTVLFRAMPGTIIHEIIGLLVFSINICLPLVMLAVYMRPLYSEKRHEAPVIKQVTFRKVFFLFLLVAGSALVRQNHVHSQAGTPSLHLPDMQQSITKDGVVKYSNNHALVYVKPPAFFLGADHHPFICWRGSGYQIANENMVQINHHEVFTFELHKEGEPVLYSCWWYTNGLQHTCSQFTWRMAAIKGDAAFSVINVSAPSREACLTITKQLLN
ncbi:exosortase N [Carboxylicivirga mesophila]|uniref:Exosortase N n=1 Tax=Carboxylicivirga mesophila TaxID=1166478 RepID=A0ABS5KCY7_9BACT|nr:exosortase N [Carboxylicivirga mesophila]MBS2212208.1 exosortase N [Carboxylicivirga mesophila]